jgi:hypothetical protein
MCAGASACAPGMDGRCAARWRACGLGHRHRCPRRAHGTALSPRQWGCSVFVGVHVLVLCVPTCREAHGEAGDTQTATSRARWTRQRDLYDTEGTLLPGPTPLCSLCRHTRSGSHMRTASSLYVCTAHTAMAWSPWLGAGAGHVLLALGSRGGVVTLWACARGAPPRLAGSYAPATGTGWIQQLAFAPTAPARLAVAGAAGMCEVVEVREAAEGSVQCVRLCAVTQGTTHPPIEQLRWCETTPAGAHTDVRGRAALGTCMCMCTCSGMRRKHYHHACRRVLYLRAGCISVLHECTGAVASGSAGGGPHLLRPRGHWSCHRPVHATACDPLWCAHPPLCTLPHSHTHTTTYTRP